MMESVKEKQQNFLALQGKINGELQDLIDREDYRMKQ